MISLSYADRRTRLGTLILDLTLTEEVDFDGEVTQFPVEDGVTVSDHITQGAERVRISGTVPTVSVGSYEADEEGRYKVIDVVDQCRRLHESREVVQVITGQLLYRDMGVARLRAARKADGEGGNWLSIDAELVKIRKVSLRTVEVPEERRVAETDGAKGRSGQTNKAAGKNAAGGEQFGPPRPPASAAKNLQRLREAFGVSL